jgi:hypothetical protein
MDTVSAAAARPGTSAIAASALVDPSEPPPVGARRAASGLFVAAVVFTGWLLWQARTVGFYYLGVEITVVALLLAWALVEGGWLLVLATLRVARGCWWPSYRLPGRRLLLGWFAVVALLVALKVPLIVNVLASGPALQARVHAAQAGDAGRLPGRVAGFDVDEIRRTNPGCSGPECEVVLIFDANSSGPSALVWTHDPAHRYLLSAGNGHLFGDWYWAVEE